MQRDHQFDNVKAFLIYCVVLGHVLDKFADFGGWHFLYSVIFTFHMPAFLFVSGYFAHYQPKKFYARMFPLYVIFQTAQYFLRRFLEFATTGEADFKRFDFFTPQWTLWYLLALMMFQLLLPVFDTEKRRHQALYLFLTVALGLMMGFTQDTDNFMSMSRVFVFLPFYLLGFYERKNGFVLGFCRNEPVTAGGAYPRLERFLARFCQKEHAARKKWLAVAAAAAIVLILWLSDDRIVAAELYGKESYDDFGMLANRVYIYIMACAWILILFILIPRRRLGGWLERIGRNTLPIYLLHTLCLLCLRAALSDVWAVENPVFVLGLAAGLTFLFSQEVFARLIQKMRIYYEDME